MPKVRFTSRFSHKAPGELKRTFPRDWYGDVSRDVLEAAREAGAVEIEKPRASRSRATAAAASTKAPAEEAPALGSDQTPQVASVSTDQADDADDGDDGDDSLASFGTRAGGSLDDDGDDGDDDDKAPSPSPSPSARRGRRSK